MKLQDNHLNIYSRQSTPKIPKHKNHKYYIYSLPQEVFVELHNTSCNIVHKAWANETNMNRSEKAII